LHIHSFIHPHLLFLSSNIHSTLGSEHTSAKFFFLIIPTVLLSPNILFLISTWGLIRILFFHWWFCQHPDQITEILRWSFAVIS
jgi:hypothetical protein